MGGAVPGVTPDGMLDLGPASTPGATPRGRGRRTVCLCVLAACVLLALLAPRVRDLVAEAMALAGLDSADPWERAESAERLVELGSQRAVPRLLAIVREEDAFPPWAARSLAAIHPYAVTLLARELDDADPRARRNVLEAFAILGEAAREALPAVIERLEDGDESVREAAVTALAVHDDGAVTALARAFAERRELAGQSGVLDAVRVLEWSGIDVEALVPPIAAVLADADAPTREAVLSLLWSLEEQAAAAVPALVALLGEVEGDVLHDVAWALGEIGDNALPAIFEAAKRGPLRRRVAALGALEWVSIPSNGLLRHVAPLLDDPNLEVALAAADVLRVRMAVYWPWLRDDEARPGLLDAVSRKLDSGPAPLRAAAAQALGAAGGPAAPALPHLRKALRDDDPAVRVDAALAIEQITDDTDSTAIRVIRDAFRSDEASVRARAIRGAVALFDLDERLLSLAVEGAEHAEGDLLAEVIDTFDVSSRVRVLVKTQSDADRFTRVLVRVLEEEVAKPAAERDADLLEDVFGLLAWLGPPAGRAIEPLRSLLPHADRDTRFSAAWTLLAIDPSELSHARETVLEMVVGGDLRWIGALEYRTRSHPAVGTIMALLGSDEGVSALANGSSSPELLAFSLRDFGPVLVDPLIAALGHERAEIRRLAALTLKWMREEKAAAPALPALRTRLADPDAAVREAAALAIGELDGWPGTPLEAVLAALESESADVRTAAARGLAARGEATPEVVEALARALGDADVEVRLGAADALAALGRDTDRVVDTLAQALGEHGENLRVHAAWSLRDLGPAARAALPHLERALAAETDLLRAGRGSDDAADAFREAIESIRASE